MMSVPADAACRAAAPILAVIASVVFGLITLIRIACLPLKATALRNKYPEPPLLAIFSLTIHLRNCQQCRIQRPAGKRRKSARRPRRCPDTAIGSTIQDDPITGVALQRPPLQRGSRTLEETDLGKLSGLLHVDVRRAQRRRLSVRG